MNSSATWRRVQLTAQISKCQPQPSLSSSQLAARSSHFAVLSSQQNLTQFSFGSQLAFVIWWHFFVFLINFSLTFQYIIPFRYFHSQGQCASFVDGRALGLNIWHWRGCCPASGFCGAADWRCYISLTSTTRCQLRKYLSVTTEW